MQHAWGEICTIDFGALWWNTAGERTLDHSKMKQNETKQLCFFKDGAGSEKQINIK